MADGPTGPDATFCAASAAFDSLVRGASVGVAVSGGSDSMALLALLHRWADGRDVRISAATVDHGLRVEARAEAERVAAFCASRGIRHEILTLGDLSGPGNLSARARDARYAALTAHFLPQGCVTDAPYETSADAVGCVRDAPLVLLGHTMDDQAETVLMRLARGSGAEGLSAMAPERHAHGIRWVRPLLALRRDALRDWLRAEGIAWIDDPTNADPRYDRVKARRALEALTPLGLTAEGVADTAARLARQSEVLRTAATELSAAAVSPGPLWSWQID
ncbi:MAG: tRNA lysidine(34) synthetase TilS, partial [Pseudomonadota bacterium]